MVFEAMHDIARPVEALAAARALLADGGCVIIGDERVAEAFTAPGDEVERLMYGFSILHCLPASRTESPSAATGTVLRPRPCATGRTRLALDRWTCCRSRTRCGASIGWPPADLIEGTRTA